MKIDINLILRDIIIQQRDDLCDECGKLSEENIELGKKILIEGDTELTIALINKQSDLLKQLKMKLKLKQSRLLLEMMFTAEDIENLEDGYV